ncbi:MAG: hypothetical protein A3J46_01775 [Candidatus Yanofskybacteria bacterium RIFCSPHIGHO2_02_FULL_41_11]|uniref:Uncharacterized protein n=1 Tax=Candidatus Yanofskybacteria bacterium RIFCSPHIGHO2_02_FULL_41_11 TaxID=1802675 RepID=A0A1F8FB42_9BACT|nr:MAG: hypothetical protein A3J46_01775 [Candidatus Yanofskybacteria bacterium RIFCSPHIGHO2_02_FULL_41_11]
MLSKIKYIKYLTIMPFKQTEKYKEKLEQIRREPQETSEEKDAKREHAREFRMEVMLDNARLMQDLTSQLAYNFWATKEHLAISVEKFAQFLAHPEVVETFIDDLLATQKKVLEMVNRRSAEQGGKHVAQSFYQELVRDKFEQYKFHGKMELDASYPLALILYVENEEDFKRIDPRKNIGGFYNSSISVFDFTSGQTIKFPMIVIKGSRENNVQSGLVTVEEHEKGHAEHKRLQSTLKTAERKVVWLDLDRPSQIEIDWLKNSWIKDQEKKYVRDYFDKIVVYALERAKDEILAEFKVTGSLDYIFNLLNKEGVYDYFKELGIDTDSELYKDLWREYENKISPAYKAANRVVAAYKIFGLSERIDLMRWVLGQIPLKDWDKQITNSAFWEEADKLFYYFKEKSLLDESRFKQLKLAEAQEQCIDELKRNQSGSLLPYINKLLAQLESAKTT